MKSIVIQAVPEHFRVNVCTASTRVFQFLDNERRSAFAHHESIAQRIKRTTRESGVARPSAHGFDNVERLERQEWVERRAHPFLDI